ncbi:hypothetical protein J2W51_002301 [Tardiphaga robiniae]|uniref:hypothetical protein n=1 Tax=Tardiphaga robiniae TaxID=943830 RepID=UPI00285B2F89|nr:hypothetical protein [Tardiphaga robiniae]MDR6659731.1 hypothetical protein [Tardiphaga robiniae]
MSVLQARLNDLETPICDAHLMSGITTVMVLKLAHQILAYKGSPDNITAARMAEELDEIADQVTFAAYRLEDMLLALKTDYMAPIDEVAA